MNGISTHVAGPVATLRINRPQKINALDLDMWHAIPRVLAELANNAQTRVLIVTGAADVFSAGADIDDLANDPEALIAASVAAEQALATFPNPTIARIKGTCIGGGCQLAIACDLRFADTTARFGVTPAMLGMIYPPSSIAAMINQIGPATTKYLLYTANTIDATHALRLGLIDELLQPSELDKRIDTLTKRLCGLSQLTQQPAKATISQIISSTPDHEFVLRRLAEAQSSGELSEAIRAFRDHTPPAFPWPFGNDQTAGPDQSGWP